MDYSTFYNATAAAAPYGLHALPPTPVRTDSEEGFPHGSPDFVDPGTFPGFDAFDPHFAAAGMAAFPQSPKSSELHGSVENGLALDLDLGLDDADQRNGRSSSEEKESLTPAQSRRKAQNRAAQRAFRERKERHVKDLENKLSALEATSNSLLASNERLKHELERSRTENEILRATSQVGHGVHTPASGPTTVTGPMAYSPTDFYSSVLGPHENKSPSHRIMVNETTGERLLGAGATWDFIVNHELFKRGLVDVGDVCERLKKKAKCDGQGPTFEERDVRIALEESVGAGSDELI